MQIGLLQRVVPTHEQRVMDHVLEFADVARPAVCLEPALGARVDAARPVAEAAAVVVEEVACERQDVARAFAQRRHRELRR